MNSVSVTYQFTRDSQSLRGFLSSNRPSTDAMALLVNWQAELPTREYEVVEDTDNVLVATLRTTQADVNSSQGHMDSRCEHHGLTRVVV